MLFTTFQPAPFSEYDTSAGDIPMQYSNIFNLHASELFQVNHGPLAIVHNKSIIGYSFSLFLTACSFRRSNDGEDNC